MGAAILTALRAGGQWTTPFQVELMGYPINLIETPPRQVQAIFMAQARRALDNELIQRTVKDYDVVQQITIRRLYQYGIDWECVRQVLNDSNPDYWGGDKAGRTALHTVVGRGFWPEERRWKAGRLGTSTCEACFMACGDEDHKFGQCEALEAHQFWKRVAGTYSSPTHANPSRSPDMGGRRF